MEAATLARQELPTPAEADAAEQQTLDRLQDAVATFEKTRPPLSTPASLQDAEELIAGALQMAERELDVLPRSATSF